MCYLNKKVKQVSPRNPNKYHPCCYPKSRKTHIIFQCSYSSQIDMISWVRWFEPIKNMCDLEDGKMAVVPLGMITPNGCEIYTTCIFRTIHNHVWQTESLTFVATKTAVHWPKGIPNLIGRIAYCINQMCWRHDVVTECWRKKSILHMHRNLLVWLHIFQEWALTLKIQVLKMSQQGLICVVIGRPCVCQK